MLVLSSTLPAPSSLESDQQASVLATARAPKQLALRTIRNGWTAILLLAIGDIALFHFGGLRSPINRSFNIAREDAIGTWFSILQLVGASILCCLLYRQAKASRAPAGTRWSWGYLTVLFLYMSIDDAAKIHERLGTVFSEGVSFFPSYAWQAVYAPIFGTATLVLLYVAWRLLDHKVAQVWTATGVGFLITAVGLDFLEGIEPSNDSGASSSSSVAAPAKAVADVFGANGHDIAHFQRVLEESMEMAAITLFLAAFLLQLGSVVQRIGIEFTSLENSSSTDPA